MTSVLMVQSKTWTQGAVEAESRGRELFTERVGISWGRRQGGRRDLGKGRMGTVTLAKPGHRSVAAPRFITFLHLLSGHHFDQVQIVVTS